MIGKLLFPITKETTYLDTAAEGIPPSTAIDAFANYMRAKTAGSPGRQQLYDMERICSATAARLLETDPANIALLSSASEGLNSLANSIDWREGDEVLISDIEFPSNAIAWLRLRDRGVKLQVVPAGGTPQLHHFTDRIGPRTRLVSVSFVSYKSGTRLPFLRELGEAAHRAGALLCVDATQGLGRVPLNVAGIDFLVSSSYKWLLGPHGLGITYVSPELRERLAPSTAGWYSVDTLFRPDRFERFDYKPGANRLQPGFPNFPGAFALTTGMNFLLGLGIARIHAELRPRVQRLREGIVALGLTPLTPESPEYDSGIVSFEHSQPQELGKRLAAEDVIVWSGDGRVRAAVHIYNDEADIERFLAVLERVLQP